MNKVAERAIEYMIRPIKSYTGNGLLEQITVIKPRKKNHKYKKL